MKEPITKLSRNLTKQPRTELENSFTLLRFSLAFKVTVQMNKIISLFLSALLIDQR